MEWPAHAVADVSTSTIVLADPIECTRNPEILGQILSVLSTRDNARAARVSKFWCDVAVSFIWKELRNIEVILRLLAPLAVRDGKVAFARPLTTQGWARFDHYARRVHGLGLKDFRDSLPLHPSLVKAILTTRSPSNFLQSLQCLQLGPSTLDRADILLHSTVTSFSVWLPNDFQLVGSILSSLPAKTPKLKELVLNDGNSRAPDADIERILAEALQKLPSLNKLSLPTLWHTSTIFCAAATCPRLSELRVRDPVGSGKLEAPAFEHLFSTSLPPHGFPSLSVFVAPMPLPRAMRIFSQPGCFEILSRLSIDSPSSEGPREYGALLETLSDCCPNLKDLSFIGSRPPRKITDRVTLNELSHIMKFKDLEALYLQHTMPFQLVAEEVLTMVRALPKLTHITLNSCPEFELTTPLDVSVLASLYKLRPNLVTLGLYLDASAERIPPPTGDDEYVPASLCPESAELDLSTSYMTEPIPLAMYLSRVLPPSWDLLISPRQSRGGVSILENWQQVMRLMPAFTQAREEAYELGVRHGERHGVLRHPPDD
ncbi:hypothetical protein EYR40_006225 [Pleurotus pulmonarius]|nr:hypothetical protein EYR40_006225 [Pleurotus pulmonarius]